MMLGFVQKHKLAVHVSSMFGFFLLSSKLGLSSSGTKWPLRSDGQPSRSFEGDVEREPHTLQRESTYVIMYINSVRSGYEALSFSFTP